MIKRTLIAMAFVMSLLSASAHEPISTHKLNFIEKYKQIAITEMERSGIPASITLGQAILESGWGNSKLAIRSNNFFGIKCKSEWTGGTYYHEDDDYDATGKLINSCFRVYPSIEASFVDHTNFLKDRPYYKSCFQHAPNQYVEWAIGLQDCGYATAKDYAVRLIEVIEEYQLFHYDQQIMVSTPAIRPNSHQNVIRTTMTNPHQDKIRTTMANTTIASTQTLAAPEVYRLPDNYQRGMMDQKMAAKSGLIVRQQLPSTQEATVYRRERLTKPKNKMIHSTYKKHVRPITHLPKATNYQSR